MDTRSPVVQKARYALRVLQVLTVLARVCLGFGIGFAVLVLMLFVASHMSDAPQADRFYLRVISELVVLGGSILLLIRIFGCLALLTVAISEGHLFEEQSISAARQGARFWVLLIVLHKIGLVVDVLLGKNMLSTQLAYGAASDIAAIFSNSFDLVIEAGLVWGVLWLLQLGAQLRSELDEVI